MKIVSGYSVIVLFLAVQLVSCKNESKLRPNILVILADDIGRGDLRFYNNTETNPEGLLPPQLPNIESLAESGMCFTNANTPSSLCAPNRYCILSGNYVWRGTQPMGMWKPIGNGSQFRPEQRSIAALLQQDGYQTAMFGKVHLGSHAWPKDPKPEGVTDPRKITNFNSGDRDYTKPLLFGVKDQGFDYSYVLYNGIQGAPFMYFRNDLPVGFDMSRNLSEQMVYWEGGTYPNQNGESFVQDHTAGIGHPDFKTNEVGAMLTRDVLDFIDRWDAKNKEGDKDNPFFIYYCSQAVHIPHTPPNWHMGKRVAEQTKDSKHTDMLLELDITVGMIMDALRERKLLENTLVVFTSDNGGLPQNIEGCVDNTYSRHNSNYGVRGCKKKIWEGGHRVPLIASWGDGSGKSPIKPGTVTSQLVGVHDLYCTLAEVAGVSVPSDQGLDSQSFLPFLMSKKPGEMAAIRDHIFYTGYDEDRPGKGKFMTATLHYGLCEGNLKLITTTDFKPVELYDLAKDPLETDNLLEMKEYAQRIGKMAQVLQSGMALRGTVKRTTPVPSW